MSKYLLLLNECDRPDQCNTSPEAAAVAWREWEAQYPAARLVGPNTSRAGWEWLLAWRAAYLRLYGEPPRIWALGIHCYNSAAWCQDWTTAHLALAREWTTSGQVWVTEWATTGCYYSEPKPADVDEAVDEAEDLQAWFDSQPGVGRTAWFVLRLDSAACLTALIGPDGTETAYGAWHRDDSAGRLTMTKTPTAQPPARIKTYLVQVLASIEVQAVDKQEAGDMGLDALARRCELRRDLFVRVEELRD